MTGITMNDLNVLDFPMISQNLEPEPAFRGTFEVFYDGQCPLCKREIDMVRGKDQHQRLRLTDIADPEFDPSLAASGKTLDELMRQIHGRLPDGELVTGPDVFRQIYGRLGYARLVSLSRWPVIRQLIDAGYWMFAKLRYRHALHRMRKTGTDCHRCGIPNEDTSGQYEVTNQ